MSYVQSIRSKITVAGDVADLHARWRITSSGSADVAFCGVYVHPVASYGADDHCPTAHALVPGYWYFPEGPEARELLTVAGVLS